MEAYRETKDEKYYTCFRDYCERWISDNADEKRGDGWHPYTISLRLTNLWICLDGLEGRVGRSGIFSETDRQHVCPVSASQKKLELHLLGNHYLENLKAVMLGALYFKEPEHLCGV